MATDAAGLAIALLAIRLGRRPADERRSFGYRRLEILAAALNAALLFVVAGYVLVEAVLRFRSPEAIDTAGMIVVAAAGLAVNAIAIALLRGGRGESLNVRGAYLEVWADFLGSVAVLAGALLIRYTALPWIDPLIAVAIALWVLPRGFALLRDALHVLLEGTPEGIDPRAVQESLKSVRGVVDVHDLHIWSVTTGVPLLSAHLRISELARWDETLKRVQALLAERHGVHHVTLQPEAEAPCDSPPCGGGHHA
jgi:cobalt-zinc-cadmium efflux system protein